MSAQSVLFVCLGNICRSPLAEGIFRHMAEAAGRSSDLPTDSAGTGGWHEGEPPDRRSIAVAADHGVDISRLRARQIQLSDFASFDIIIGMDRSNLANLKRLAPIDARSKVHLFSAVALDADFDVPDPYYGGPADFERVYQMVSDGCRSLVGRL